MEEQMVLKSALAEVSLETYQFHAVKITGVNTINICSTDGEMAYGILQNKPKIAEAGSVAVLGTCKAVSGAVVTAGNQVMTDATGHLIHWTAAGSKFPLGTALTTTTAAGELFSLDLDARSCKVS